MAFGTFKKSKYPVRQWAIKAPARFGKSTLCANLKHPIVVADTDNRFATTKVALGLSDEQVMPISNDRAPHVDADAFAAELSKNRRESSKIGTVLLDSATGMIQPIVMEAMRLPPKLRASKMLEKAMAMRTVIDALQNFGCDYAIIYHQEGRCDNAGEKIVHETIPAKEREAMYRALNMELELVTERDADGRIVKHGVKVLWARDGEDGMTIWDPPGNMFRGMPERIEEAVYRNGIDTRNSKGAPAEAPSAPPAQAAAGEGASTQAKLRFANKDAALSHAVECGAYATIEDAATGYEAVKREQTGKVTAHSVFEAWHHHCEALRPANVNF